MLNFDQVEFYFGDHNLPTDKYLWGLTDGSSNKPVPLKNICKFKRMQRFQPYEAVVAALKESYFLDVVGEDGEEMVKRKTAYSPQDQVKRLKREQSTVYVKGFGDETPTTQFDLEAFFCKFGDVAAVRLRRTDEKLFKGSVFVEFQDEAKAKEFLERDPPPQWEGHDLKIQSKQDYVAEKTELIKKGAIQPNSSRKPTKFYEGRGGKDKFRKGGSDHFDKDDWKKRRDHDQKNGFRDRHGGHGGRGGRGRGRGFGRGGRGGRESRPEREEAESNDNEYVHPYTLEVARLTVTAFARTLTSPSRRRGPPMAAVSATGRRNPVPPTRPRRRRLRSRARRRRHSCIAELLPGFLWCICKFGLFDGYPRLHVFSRGFFTAADLSRQRSFGELYELDPRPSALGISLGIPSRDRN